MKELVGRGFAELALGIPTCLELFTQMSKDSWEIMFYLPATSIPRPLRPLQVTPDPVIPLRVLLSL